LFFTDRCKQYLLKTMFVLFWPRKPQSIIYALCIMQMLFTNIDLHVYLTTGSQQQQHWHCFGFFKINLRLISTYTSRTCKWTLKENTVVMWFHQIIHRVTNMYLMFDFLLWNAKSFGEQSFTVSSSDKFPFTNQILCEIEVLGW
jgi:hypothetical protein